MNKNRKADLCGIGSKTLFDGQSNQGFSVSDSTTGLEHIAAIIERTMHPGKVVRLFRCFACNRHFPALRMSAVLCVCRECANGTHGKGTLARRNQIDRITNAIRIFLRARLENGL